MAVAYRSGDKTSAGPPFIVTEPAGAAEGDFMLAFGTIKSVDGNWSIPADFTLIDEFSELTGTDSQVFIAFKIRGATAGNGYSFGYNGTDANATVILAAYSGNNLGLDVTYSKASHYSATLDDRNAAAKAIITETDAAIVALCYMAMGSAIDSFGASANYTQRVAAAGASRNVHLSDRIIASAGTETPGVFTHTDAIEDQDQRTFTIAIAELSVGGRTVNANTDTLVVTEQSAVTNRKRNASTMTDALVIAEQAITVNRKRGVTTIQNSLIIIEQSAEINRQRNVDGVLDALVIAERQATMTFHRGVNAITDILVINELIANIGEILLTENLIYGTIAARPGRTTVDLTIQSATISKLILKLTTTDPAFADLWEDGMELIIVDDDAIIPIVSFFPGLSVCIMIDDMESLARFEALRDRIIAGTLTLGLRGFDGISGVKSHGRTYTDADLSIQIVA